MSIKTSAVPCLLATILLVPVSTGQAQELNPLAGNGSAARAGGALFRAQCATCHGADAKGIDSIDAPDLTQMWQQRELIDADVFQVIKNGVPGTIMPPHAYTDTQIWMLVTFLRSVAVSGVAELPEGDVMGGSRLFADQCAECHRVGSAGGVLGPQLTAILERRSLEAIVNSVREPHAQITSGYRTVTAVTSAGERVSGVLKNEDAFSLQMIDSSQRLRSFNKRELAELERPSQSLMPAFDQDQLSDGQLMDILNFIQFTNDEVSQ